MSNAAVKLDVSSFKESSSAEKKERLVKVYDKAIDACKYQNKSLALKTLYTLRSSLESDIDKNVTENLSFLYGYFIFKIKNSQYDEVHVMLNDIRKTWIQSIKV